MHGIIYLQLFKFIREAHGFEVLDEIKKKAGLEHKFHYATESYDDDQIQVLIEAGTEVLGLERDALLEAFGKFIAPGLLVTYGSYIKPEWKCMDVLENVENTIHRVVRMKTENSDPPKLEIIRKSTHELIINYTSARKMSAFGVGIIRALAAHFKEEVDIQREPIEQGVRIRVRTK